MSNRERQKLITEIIDFHSDPESFPRMYAQVDTFEILEYIDKCEERAREDERRRVATALLDEARVFDSDFASERTWDSGIAVKLEDDVRLILGATGVIEPGKNGDE